MSIAPANEKQGAALGGRGDRRGRGGFTLLEITLAVAILAMMSVAIYRFVQANATAIRVSTEASASEARFDGLRDLLAQQLQNLPSGQGALSGSPFKLNDIQRDELTWIASAGVGVLTRYAPGEYQVSLQLRRENEKSDKFDIGISRIPRDDRGLAQERETWVPLIADVKSMQIRYFDPRLNTWVDRWSDTIVLPRLVRLIIGRNDASVPFDAIVALGRTSL